MPTTTRPVCSSAQGMLINVLLAVDAPAHQGEDGGHGRAGHVRPGEHRRAAYRVTRADRARAASERRPTAPDGVVVVDKPAGWTSHDVVARMRWLAGTRKVGHAGTLDPMATGVLVVGIGRATRLLTYIVGADKEYTATIRLGVSTTTDDAEGETLAVTDASGRDRARPSRPGSPR